MRIRYVCMYGVLHTLHRIWQPLDGRKIGGKTFRRTAQLIREGQLRELPFLNRHTGSPTIKPLCTTNGPSLLSYVRCHAWHLLLLGLDQWLSFGRRCRLGEMSILFGHRLAVP